MSNMIEENKVALVTGASAGIGEATAIEYAKLNFKVAITGRNMERLASTLEKLVEVSPSKSLDFFLVMQADFEDLNQLESLIIETVAKFGRLDYLINNAGYLGMKRDITDADFFQDFQKILQVNLVAQVRLSQLALLHLIKSKGVIINVSSLVDRLAIPSISLSVSKAGLSMLTKTLASALDGTGVRVITVAPGPILTNSSADIEGLRSLTTLRRLGTASEVANLIVFLTSEKASYINGCTMDIDGGLYAKFAGAFSMFSKSMASDTTGDTN